MKIIEKIQKLFAIKPKDCKAVKTVNNSVANTHHKEIRNIMPNEEQVKKTAVEETDNSEKEKEIEKSADETAQSDNEKDAPIEQEKDETKESVKETENCECDKPIVKTTEEQGNAVRVEDIVTKEYLNDRFSALEAKFDAVINENKALKDKIAGMQDKYENKDFGGYQKNGVDNDNNGRKVANETFDEYMKRFAK